MAIGASVQVTGVNRQLDLFVQSQLRTETSGGAYADQMSNILSQLQNVYGTPGGDGTIETSYSNFTTALQALSTSQGSQSAQTHGAGGSPIAGADAELDDAGHPGAAIERPTGYRHVGARGQHRYEPDRDHQLAAAGVEPDRSRGRDADGSARQRDQRSIEIGGRSCCHRLVQSGQRLHDFRHATCRRPTRVQDEFLFAGVADGEFAVQHATPAKTVSDRSRSSFRTAPPTTWSRTIRSVRVRSRPT